MNATLTQISGRNPFLASRVAELQQLFKTLPNAVDELNRFLRDQSFSTRVPSLDVQKHLVAAQMMAADYASKPNVTRFFGFKKDRESSRIWVVLNRETSARLLEASPSTDELEAACAELWAQWGYSAGESYTGPGCRYTNALQIRVSRGCIVLQQYSGIDC